MINVISAELSKLRTARSNLIMCIVAVGLSLAFALLVTLAHKHSEGPAGEALISAAGFSVLFTLILGVLTIAGEMRHGSIAPALLVTPVRERLMAGKLAAVLLVCGALGALSIGGGLAIGALLGPGQGLTLGLSSGEVLRAIGSGALVAALMATIGLGVGALLRNQAGAIVLVLVWLFFVDPLLSGLFAGFKPLSLTEALNPAIGAPSESGSDDPPSQAQALGLIAAYAFGLLAAGTAVFRRVEITG